MTYTGAQVSTYGQDPARLFFLDATMLGSRLTCCTSTQTVTVFNDLCLLAPAALVSAPIVWQPSQGLQVRGTYTNGTQSVTAGLVFDADGNLVDFVSDDRSRASADGKSFTGQRWSTPAPELRTRDGRRLCTRGEAWWHAPDPVGQYPYIEMSVDAISYNTTMP